MLIPYHIFKSVQLVLTLEDRKLCFQTPYQMTCSDLIREIGYHFSSLNRYR